MNRKGIILSMTRLLVASCLFFCFLSGCGLDTFYYLNPPTTVHFINEAETTSQDAEKHYVSFVTASNPDSQDIFQGTAVYYKIYNDKNTLISNHKAIESLNDNNSNQGINRLFGWGYQPLTTDEINTVNLVSSGSVGTVSIRLFNEIPQSGGGYSYSAEVSVDGVDKGIPLRSFDGKNFSFNTNANPDDPNSVPRDGQEDVWFSPGISTDIWYVALYAVSTGTSPSLTPVYSSVTFLGSLAIKPTTN